MTAFEHAWTLLKQRGFEVDPRYEDERMQRLEQGYDERDRLTDNLRDVNARMDRRGAFADDNDYDERDNLENELYQLMQNPEGAQYGDPPMNMIQAQTGPMFQAQQRQEAQDIEAEGIDLPDGPRVSAVPPAEFYDTGRAGSTSSEPIRRPRFNPFDPNEVALMRQTLANQQTPMGQALARVRAGSGPQPLQFDQ
jgi:hypothetical protein